MREKNYCTSVLVHMVYHVLYKSKVCFALRCKFSIFIETFIFQKMCIGRPFCRIRGIRHLNTELHISKAVMFQGVTIVYIEITVRNTTQYHVHTSKVICCRCQFLTIIISYVCIFFQSQQKRARTAGWVGSGFDISQSKAGKTA